MKLCRTDLSNAHHVDAFLALMQDYATSTAGGGAPLPDEVLSALPASLAKCPTYIGLLAWDGDEAVGLLNAFWSIATFKAKRLLNIHDVAVSSTYQRRGVGQQLLSQIEVEAAQIGCAKLTLEVLEHNQPALTLYKKIGFAPYGLDPSMGSALFMHKVLDEKQ